MPSLQDLGLLPSPLVDPLCYPGAALQHSFLLTDAWVYRIRSPAGAESEPCRVDVDGGPLAGQGPVSSLDAALLGSGATPMRGRSAVVAFGSNASPAQLWEKFASSDPAARVIPVLRGSVSGLRLSHSPHVSPAGYVPYVVVDGGADAELDACVLWLDVGQLARLGGTEPNYRLVAVPADRYPLRLEMAEPVRSYRAYRGKWGALRWSGDTAPAVAVSQHEVFGRFGGDSWFRDALGDGDILSWISRLRAQPALRNRVRQELAARGLVTGDGWRDGGPPDEATLRDRPSLPAERDMRGPAG